MSSIRNVFMSAIVAMAFFFSSSLAEQLSPIDLGSAKAYAVLAGSTVTSSGTVGTIITGDIGLYPGTEVSGFPPGVNNGAIYAAPKTEGSIAQGSLTTAYNQAADLPFNVTLSSMDLGGMILSSNVYKFAGAADMNGVLTLDANGDADAVWVFQIASSLLVAEASSFIFKDDIGNPDHVYWQVGSSATIGKNVPMIGNIMAFDSITLNDGASMNGRCLARNAAVTLDNNVVTIADTAVQPADSETSSSPSAESTAQPTIAPSSTLPSSTPSSQPSPKPSVAPSTMPTHAPSQLHLPSTPPSLQPTHRPTQPTALHDTGEEILPIDLGFAQPYAILAGSTVTSTGTVGTIVTGDIGLYPGTAVTGFPPGVLNGAIYAAPSTVGLTAQGSLTTAYNQAAGLPYNITVSSTDLGGMILTSNVYKFAGAANMNGMLTLDANGDARAVWVFQIDSSFLVAEGSSIIFKDGIGNPDYVYWQVGSSATIGKNVPMIGNILALDSITLNTGASLKGRCLARNAAVTLDNNVVTKPKTVSFAAKQTISGISLEQFNADHVLNSATLKEAIAETMTGVFPSNIKKLTTASSARFATSSMVLTALRALSAADSILVTYDVVVPATMNAEELKAQLTAAVADGTFSIYLQMAATANGATALQFASSEAIATETMTDDSIDSSSSNSDTLSTFAIVGIAVGGFVALVLIAALIYYFVAAGNGVSVGVGGQKVAVEEV